MNKAAIRQLTEAVKRTWALDARVPVRQAKHVRPHGCTYTPRRHRLAVRVAAGVRPRAVERALHELRARVDLRIDGIDELPFDGGVLRKLRRAVEYRREQLR